jgi:hypothetical protein
VKHWNLTALPPSTEKQHPREPGADAPRVHMRRLLRYVVAHSDGALR